MTHLYARHDSFISVPWLIYTRDVTYFLIFERNSSYAWHASCIRDVTHVHMCDVTHSIGYCNSFICVTWLTFWCLVFDMAHLSEMSHCSKQSKQLNESRHSARPYESCKIFKGRPRRNAFSKLVHRQYKPFPPDRFCQVEIKNPTRMSNNTSNAWSCAEDQILENKKLRNMILNICTER